METLFETDEQTHTLGGSFEACNRMEKAVATAFFKGYGLFFTYYKVNNKDSGDLGNHERRVLETISDLKYNDDDDILVCGAIKLLTEISLKNNNFEEALRNLDKAKNYKFSNSLILDLQLMKAFTFLNMDDSKNGKAILEKINNQKDLPSHIKQRIEELYGMI